MANLLNHGCAFDRRVWSWSAFFILVGFIASASADPLAVGDGKVFRLGSESLFQRGCFPPCMCPLLEQADIRGTMVLRFDGMSQGTQRYAVRDVNWSVPVSAQGDIRVTGAGFYEIGSPDPITVLQQRMVLELNVGEGPTARFDSGWVPITRPDGILITVSLNGLVCWDVAFTIDALPVPLNEILPYKLTDMSTFQRGCFDPCDCPPGPVLPLGGTFDLIPLVKTPFFSEFAVVDARWQVPSTSAAGPSSITGFGVYRLLGDFVLQDRLILDMIVGDGQRTRFDSGRVVGGSSFPVIDKVVSINGINCFDTVMHVVGAPDTRTLCGGISGTPCANPNEFCKLPIGGCCCDFTGVCTPIPPPDVVCPAVYDPVCGCDGITYGNDCEADKAGVSIDHRGECDRLCDPVTGQPCPNTEFCKLPPGVCSNAPNQGGVCTERPTVCPDLFDPVCGCDGVTYGNECQADAAGVSIDHPGPCDSAACCLPNGTCIEIPPDLCLAGGGRPDPNARCAVVDCVPLPTGACCLAQAGLAGCIATSREACLLVGGSYLGDDTTCPVDPGLPCEPPSGACCSTDPAGVASCAIATREVCLLKGGTYLGDGSTCPADSTLPCAPPTGACCLSALDVINAGCLALTQEQCRIEGGAYLGDGTSCPTDPTMPCEPVCPVACPVDLACFTGCGTLVQGIECVVFEADSGERFILENQGGFAVGDRVFVAGCIDRQCNNLCGGDPCLARNTIRPCAQVCGGIAGIPCTNPNDFCKFPPGTCGDADIQGVCTPVPAGCPRVLDPVCGCDGVTYNNECEAAAAGVSVRHPGECEPPACVATRFLSNPEPVYCPGQGQVVEITLAPPPGVTVVALEDAPPAGWVPARISHGGTFDAVNGKVKWGPFFAPDIPPVVDYEIVPSATATGVQCFEGTISLDGFPRPICGEACVDRFCCPLMEADKPQPPCATCPSGGCVGCDDLCENSRVTLCEVISYACSWLMGCNDDLAGMTRAAFIWRHGECYCWDEGLRNWFPTDCTLQDIGCCTPTSTPPLAGLVVGERAGGARMTVSRSPRVAKTNQFTIPIVIDAPAGTTAAALEVDIGPNWHVVSISDDGAWDEIHHKVKWGPLYDRLSRTVTFTVRPLDRSGIKADRVSRVVPPTRFTGTVSFDGVNLPIRTR